jgi:MFS family permease
MEGYSFEPFYERLLGSGVWSFISKILFAIGLSAGFFILHYMTIGTAIFTQSGWLLSVIILMALLALFFATHTFRLFLSKLIALQEERDERVASAIVHYLSDRYFIYSGLFFALADIALGYIFGLPEVYATPLEQSIIGLGHMIAGFVCGVALWGIIGVIQTMVVVAESPLRFDYTADDRCGGTGFIGWALLVFSVVTLLVGILITLYLSLTPWSGERTLMVHAIFFSWLIMPYIASIFVLLVPAILINRALVRYKMEKGIKFTESICVIVEKLESGDHQSDLHEKYKFQSTMRKVLYEMRTWPFTMSTNSAYFISLSTSFYSTYTSLQGWLSKVF